MTVHADQLKSNAHKPRPAHHQKASDAHLVFVFQALISAHPTLMDVQLDSEEDARRPVNVLATELKKFWPSSKSTELVSLIQPFAMEQNATSVTT